MNKKIKDIIPVIIVVIALIGAVIAIYCTEKAAFQEDVAYECNFYDVNPIACAEHIQTLEKLNLTKYAFESCARLSKYKETLPIKECLYETRADIDERKAKQKEYNKKVGIIVW